MRILFSVLFLLLCCQAKSQLHLSAIFNDHMILQREKPVKIWGAAKAGDSVYVDIGTVKGSACTDKNGKWLITLPIQLP